MAKQLVANVLPLATHNRHKVRVAAIQAVRATMFQNAHEMILEMVAFRDPNVVAIKVTTQDGCRSELRCMRHSAWWCNSG